MKNEQVSDKKVWAPRIYDVLQTVKNMQDKPKVVLLHTSTNDLEDIDDEQIVADITEIYHLLNKRGIKLVWSNIVPRNDSSVLNSKTELINAKVGFSLMNKDGVYIARNDNFYIRDVINTSLYDEDGIHVFDKGITKLAQNARSALCRSLNKEFVTTKPKRKWNNGRNR